MRVLLIAMALALPMAAEDGAVQKPIQAAPVSAFVQGADVRTGALTFLSPAYFKRHFTTPSTHVELKPPVRLEDYVHSGRLELSLRDYLELVMANNTDIAVSRLNVETFRHDVTRQFSPFDPAFQAQFTANREKSLPTRATEGGDVVNSLAQNASFNYSQLLQTGTRLNVGFTGTKGSSSDIFTTWNPSLGANLNFGFSQPLLRNRGMSIQRLPISVARSRLRKSEYDLQNDLLQRVSDAENAYWDVVEARETLKVQEENLKLADEALKRAEKELQLGAIPQLDIYRPQQNRASAEIQVSRFRYLLAQREDALRRFISADLNPRVRNVPIVLTETVMPPVSIAPIDADQAVAKALAARPDLKSAAQSLDVDELSVKSAANSLRPDLSLNLGYVTKGRGGNYYDRQDVFGGGSTIRQIIPGGFGDALNQLFAFDVPGYQFGLTLRLPIRDRRFSSDLADALVAKKQDTLRIRSSEQRARLEVLNAINQLEAAKAGVELAKKAVEFAQKQVEAEQQKYDLGTTVLFFVLQAQTDLVTAQSELVQNSVAYQRARITLLRTTGELLDERGIVVQ